jgi:hypothetical protein
VCGKNARAVGVFAAILGLWFGVAGQASGSQLVTRGMTGISLAVNGKGEALVSYRAASGRAQHVLFWGAINARSPNPSVPQARFRLDYAGGWGKYHTQYWRTFGNRCGRYDGPPLAWVEAACKAPDGSYWALQKWQVKLPDLGFTPWTQGQRQWELHLSHWRGPLARLQVWRDWSYAGRYHHLFGLYTYRGHPVYGFSSSIWGAPREGYGRLLYLDTHRSAYGKGWRRENVFLSHNPTGIFCYGFFPHDPTRSGYVHPRGVLGMRPKGNGDHYRITAVGPGVTPDVMWSAPGLHNYSRTNPGDVAWETRMNAKLDSILGGDQLCGEH